MKMYPSTILISCLALFACKSDEKKSEKCSDNGALAGTKWCEDGYLSDDYKVLNALDNKASLCRGPEPVSEEMLSALARNADNVEPGVRVPAPGFEWSLAFGRCYFDPNTTRFTEAELRTRILSFMDSVWKNYPDNFKQTYPGCNLQISMSPVGASIPYGVMGCSPDSSIGPDGRPIVRIPSGLINVGVKVHFEAFYPQSAYDSGTLGHYLIPNAIDAKKSISYTKKMLTSQTANHDIADPAIKQIVSMDTVSETPWIHRALPQTNFWSKSPSNRFNLGSVNVVTALTTIINTDGTVPHPTKILTKFMTRDSTDITHVFNDRSKFEMDRAQHEFMVYQKTSLQEDWTLDSIRYSQMHFNLFYLDRMVSFIHLFVMQDFNGGSPHEVFCTCSGESCFEDTTYVQGCTSLGERKWVPGAEDSIYLDYTLYHPDYDGSLPSPGGQTKTGNSQLKQVIPKLLNDVIGFTLKSDSTNNSFYAFFDRKQWPHLVTDNNSDAAEALQNSVVAHEIGHHFFGSSHSTDPNHVMFKSFNPSVIPLLTLPIKNEDRQTISTFTLTPGVWSQSK